MKNIFKKIRMENYVLSFFSFVLFILYIFSNPQSAWIDSFGNIFRNLKLGATYFSFIFYFLYFYILLRLFFNIGDWLISRYIEKKEIKFSLFSLKKTENILLSSLPFLKTFFLITVFFTFVILVLGLMAVQLQSRLVNDLMMGLDRSLFGFYPSLALAGQGGFPKIFNFLIIQSFSWLGLVIGLVWVIFYLNKQRKFFSQYIIAMSLAIMFGFIGWFIWPVNSPQNAYLNNTYSQKIDIQIKEAVGKYQPSQYVSDFLGKAGVEQGGIAPISTIPSMHVAWALIIVYYLFQFRKKTIFIVLPWFLFSSFGTFYLAQHYFVDVLAAFPVAISAILIANFLVKLEKRYYQNDLANQRELEFKNKIKADFSRLFNVFKSIFFRTNSEAKDFKAK